MAKAKRLTAFFLCFVLALLPCIPASGFAITATGTAVTLATVAAVLLASGVALTYADNASYNTAITEIWNQMDSTIQDKFMDARYLASGAGAVVATYGAAAWNSISNWVTTNFLADGSSSFYIPSTDFPVSNRCSLTNQTLYPDSAFLGPYEIGSNTGILPYLNSTVFYSPEFSYILFPDKTRVNLIGFVNQMKDTHYIWPGLLKSSGSQNKLFGVLVKSGIRTVLDFAGTVFFHGELHTVSYIDGKVLMDGVIITSNYSDIIYWMADCIKTGTLVGDFTFLGYDVVNPSNGAPITCDPDTRYLPDASIDAVPSTLTGGQTIAVPLDVTLSGDNTISIPNDDVADTYRTKEVTDVAPYTVVSSDDVVVESFPESVIPDVAPGRPDVIPATPDETANKLQLPKLLLSKFPFCIPWDLYNAISIMNAPAEIPAFDYPFSFPELGIDETLHLDLNRFDTVATVVKWFLAAIWTVLLIYLTKKIVWK